LISAYLKLDWTAVAWLSGASISCWRFRYLTYASGGIVGHRLPHSQSNSPLLDKSIDWRLRIRFVSLLPLPEQWTKPSLFRTFIQL